MIIYNPIKIIGAFITGLVFGEYGVTGGIGCAIVSIAFCFLFRSAFLEQ